MLDANLTLAQSGGPPLTQYMQLLVVLLVLLFSFLGWVFRKLKERREKAESEALRRRAREEALRTGRLETSTRAGTPAVPMSQSVPSTLQPSIEDDAKRRLAELAARRRRELAEMMKQGGGSAGGAGSGGGSTMSSPPPVVPTSPAPARTAPPVAPRNSGQRTPTRPPSIEQQQRAQRERAAREKAARDAAARERAEQQERQRQAREEALERAEREQAQRDADEVPHLRRGTRTPAEPAAVARMSAAAAKAGGGVTAGADWRKAIVMAELLNRPLALREPDERTE